MPKLVEDESQLSAAARRCRTAGRRMGRHDWPDIEEIRRQDLIITASRAGKAVEAKLIIECKRKCGTTQEQYFALQWKGENCTVVPVDEAPVTKYGDFYLRKRGVENALNLDRIRTERWKDAFPDLFGAKAKSR